MLAAGRVVTYEHPELGHFEHAGLQIDFSDTPGRVWGPPPLVGQHTRGVGMRQHLRMLVGIGKVKSVDKIEIRWPSGKTTQLTGVKARTELLVVEPL